MPDQMTILMWLHVLMLVLLLIDVFAGKDRGEALALLLRYLPEILKELGIGQTDDTKPLKPPD